MAVNFTAFDFAAYIYNFNYMAGYQYICTLISIVNTFKLNSQ